VAQGFNENWLPVWLQAAGYNTYYTGKLFNAHTVENWNSPRPAGWTSSDFLLDPHTYDYLNATFQSNEHPPVQHEGEYSTDVLAKKAYGLLDEGVKSKRPFFLTLAPVAPHSNVDPTTFDHDEPARKIQMTAPIPAKRHKYLFPEAKVPRKPNFNPHKVPPSLNTLSQKP
jgi:N-acetylglucosamine-6-sulfatase